MESNQLLFQEIADEAYGIMEEASSYGIGLKLLGGIAIRTVTKSWIYPPFNRNVSDIDFAVTRKELPRLINLFERKGYIAREMFNKLNMGSRLIYYTDRGHRVDIFVEEFNMCHKIPLIKAFESGGLSIPPAELLLTKLQVVNIAEKDLLDICLMLNDLQITEDDTGINWQRIAYLCSKDWGLYTTVSENLQKVPSFSLSLPRESREKINNSTDRLLSLISKREKTIVWKIRSLLGKRLRWYQIPEEVPEIKQ